MRRVILAFISFLPLAATPFATARADDVSENIVVTATRTPQPRDRTGDSISVIDAQTLTDQQIVAVTDVLQQTPGLVVVRNGPFGQNATASLRGAEAGQTLVLIDGVRINDPSSVDNEALLGDLLVNNVERIEVLRGPQSTLYGSDAIGGVIDVITRRGGAEPFSFHANAEGGSFGTYLLNAAANGTTGAMDYGAAANILHTNGVSAADARFGNQETDGYDNLGATENVRVHLGDAVSLDLRSYYTGTRTDFDDAFSFAPPFRVADSAAYRRNRLFAGYTGFNFDLFDGRFSNRIAFADSNNVRTYYDSFFDMLHKNGQDSGNDARFEYQGIVVLSPDDQLTFGAESERVSFRGLVLSSLGNSRDNGHNRTNSIYGQYMTTLFDQVTLTAGIRHDDNQAFGGHTSIKLNAAWRLSDDATVLRANYGDGFKAPTLFELFSEFSNPFRTLNPEVAHGWEAGVDRSFFDNRIAAHLAYFERHTNDQIDFVVPDCFTPPLPDICSIRPSGYYDNTAHTRAHGVEFEAQGQLTDTLSASLAATEMRAEDATTGKDLARRPHWTASGVLTWRPTPGSTFGGSIVYIGRRFDGAGETTPLKSNTVVNVFGSYSITDMFGLYARMENALDARYEPVFGYGAAGRAIYGGIRLAY